MRETLDGPAGEGISLGPIVAVAYLCPCIAIALANTLDERIREEQTPTQSR